MRVWICDLCGKRPGTGTLLDAYPEPPRINTTLHNLYVITELKPEKFPFDRNKISPDDWEAFASKYRCLKCAADKPEDIL